MGGEHGLPPSFPPSNQGLIRLFTLPGAFSVRIVSSRSLSLSLPLSIHALHSGRTFVASSRVVRRVCPRLLLLLLR